MGSDLSPVSRHELPDIILIVLDVQVLAKTSLTDENCFKARMNFPANWSFSGSTILRDGFVEMDGHWWSCLMIFILIFETILRLAYPKSKNGVVVHTYNDTG